MPINNTVNKDEEIIYSICTGIMKPEDFDLYISTIWRTGKHYGFNELFDTVEADWNEFDFNYLLKIADTASRLKAIDPNSKLAWVVLEGKQKELTSFYKAAKSLTDTPSRSLEAFYSRDDALDWLKTRE